MANEIIYKTAFTKDVSLINQYKLLRKNLYGSDKRFVGFREFSDSTADDYDDPADQMIILYHNDQIYGGACLRISTPNNPVILNSEQDILPPAGKFYFSLKEYLPAMELDKYSYCEFVRIVVDPRLRQGIAVRRLYQAALEKCLEYRVRYMFGIADKVRTRLYRQIYGGEGMSDSTYSMPIPMRREYEGINMDLIYVDMKMKYISDNDPNAICLLNPTEDFSLSNDLLHYF